MAVFSCLEKSKDRLVIRMPGRMFGSERRLRPSARPRDRLNCNSAKQSRLGVLTR
jgi:hypothetical protein